MENRLANFNLGHAFVAHFPVSQEFILSLLGWWLHVLQQIGEHLATIDTVR